ncbi:amino acid adenylation domain-containing protein [Flavitalea antarctica]
MEIKEFIESLKKRNFSLERENDTLILKSEKNVGQDEIQAIKKNEFVINYIKENKKRLIEFLSSSTEFYPDKKSKDISSIYRLSPLQEGMMFHSLYNRGSGVYIEQFSCDIIGLELDVMRKSWSHLLKWHSILRSSFYYAEFNVPVQCVHNEASLPIQEIDYRHLDSTEQEEKIKAHQISDSQKEFDFKVAPLMRIALFRLSDNKHRMLWTYHHILVDGWSMPILMEEFLTTYDSLAHGNEPKIRDEDRYEEYIRYIERTDKQAQEAYWQHYMHGVQNSTQLPFINQKHERNRAEGAFQSLSLRLDTNLTSKAERYVQKFRLTLNTLMQGVWSYLLSRYTGNPTVVYGVVVSGRPDDLHDIHNRVGLYINTLPTRIRITDQQTIAEWLQEIQSEQVSSRQYEHTSLQDIQRIIGIPGDFFDSLLVFENYPVSKLLTNSQWTLEVGNISIKDQTNYPLNLIISTAEEIDIRFLYNIDVLPEANVRRIREHFEYVFMQIVDSAEESVVKNIKLLTSFEEEQLLLKFNNTVVTYPAEKTVLDLFREQVAKNPQAAAVRFEEEQLTYLQLNEKSNQLAHYLRAKGVKEETLVPICLDRSLDMIVGILGILKAGGAYVPVDPEYPRERIKYMLEDTGAALILTNKQSLPKIPGKDLEIIDLESRWLEIDKQPTSDPQINLSSHNLAYVIYTSGSTGRPKGVLNQHSGLFNRLCWAQDFFSLTSQDSVLQKTTFCFDVSVWELIWPLLAGARLVLAKPGGHLDIGYLKSVIETQQITMVHFVPSMLSIFLSEIKPGDCQNLKKVLCSGEALKSSQVVMFNKMLPSTELHNLYGPTEAAIDVTYWSPSQDHQESDLVPIGRPLANTSIYILDMEDRLVPLGCIGEINIGGIQVARGYLNREELSAQKFVKDVFKEGSGDKMYRTGDLGRWLPDGNIEYLGRIDDQIKIRGFRVELEEIEAGIISQPGAGNAKIIVTGDESLVGKSLNAYIEINKDRLPLLSNYLQIIRNNQAKTSDLKILPNGLPILVSNFNEVNFLYEEIFRNLCYLQNGISLNENSCVIDIGANVGFFSVFLNILSENITVYSFEPIPEIYDQLVANRNLYKVNGKAFPLALLDKEQELEFEYYPGMSILSGIGNDRHLVMDVVRRYIEKSNSDDLVSQEIDALLETKLVSKKVTCQSKTLSQIISEENLQRIDLVKIDVENSEHLVIAGISDTDWDKIDSVIIEVHDVDRRLESLTNVLTSKGFELHVEKQSILSVGDILYNIYALKPGLKKALTSLGDNEKIRSNGWKQPGQFVNAIKEHLQTNLPEYMVPSTFTLMDHFPINQNGKLDKNKFPAPSVDALRNTEYTGPRNDVETKLVDIWKELLKKEQIGIGDDFFELGGHSLLAMKMVSYIERRLLLSIPIKLLFQLRTINDLGKYIATQQKGLNEDQTSSDFELIDV